MTLSTLGQATLQALRCLKPSGEQSFEKLTATLLSLLVGVPIRLCKSGYQAGIDALAEIPIAIEDKRYASSSLDLSELEGKLAAAARTYLDLQLWVLAATIPVDPFLKRALEQTAENLGLSVLLLDSAASEPDLPGLASIVAICASAPDEIIAAMSSPAWLDDKRAADLPSISEVRADLGAIQALPRFDEWLECLRGKLTELPIWRLAVSCQNRRLAQILGENAYALFKTDFDPSKLVPRTAKSKINMWFAAAMVSAHPEIAIVVGERYDGKTWLIFEWLKEELATLPVPVFFIGSQRGKSSEKDLADYVLEDIRRVLGSFERHASATLRRQRDIKAGSTPWCMIILDGLNEYAPKADRWLEHLTWATGRADLDARPCAVLATVRRTSWQEFAGLIKDEVQEIHLGPYDDVEFQAALRLHGLPADYLASIPENAGEMVRRPRYFGLVVNHRNQLGRYDAITADVLHWLDACDKIARSWSTPAPGWDEEHFQGILMELATRYMQQQRSLKLPEIRSVIEEFSPEITTVLRDLQSEGILIKTGASYSIDRERLALGMGLFILDRLSVAREQGNDVKESLRDILSPLHGTDEMIAWLRSATTVALLSDPPKPELVIDVLVHEWLESRNLSHADFQEIRALRDLLLPPLIRLAPAIWSAESDDESLQEVARMIFADALVNHRDLVGEAVRSWCHLVSTTGSILLSRGKEDPEATIRERITDPDIADLHLKVCGDAGILTLHRVGLYLLSKAPDLIGPDDLLALIAAQEIAGDYPRDGDYLAIRRALAHVSVAWFEEQVQRLSSDPAGRRRDSLHWLITCAARADLQAAEESMKPATDPQSELWRQWSLYDRARYDKLCARPFSPDENPAHFMELARDVVRNPDLPKPCQERMIVIRRVLPDLFFGRELPAGSFGTAEDDMFEKMLPATAAWIPDIGAAIVRQQIEGLPTHAADKPRWWAFRLNQDAILADGAVRSALLTLLAAPCTTDKGHRALERVLQALLPGLQPHERIDTLINRPPDRSEWTDLYMLVASLMEADGTAYALSRLRHEVNPLYRWRLRLLLARADHLDLTAADIEQLANEIANGNDEDRFAALFLAKAGGVKDLPLEILLPATKHPTDQGSRIPDYAAWLLIHSDAFAHTTYEGIVAQLPPRWRAVAATKREDFCTIFLQEVEQVLYNTPNADSGPDIAAAALPAPVVIETTEEHELSSQLSIAPESISRSVELRSPESTTGGIPRVTSHTLEEINELLAGGDIVAEKLARLQKQAAAELARRAQEHRTCWSAHEFPLPLMAQMNEQDPSRFEAWLDALLADKRRAKFWWVGLLKSMFRVAIRTGHPRTKELWPLVFPFQRSSVAIEIMPLIGGINWVVHELSNPSAYEDTATDLLTDLVCQSLSDWELFQIALGARYQGQARLIKVVKMLLRNSNAELRARAVRIAGWLEGMSAETAEVEHSDPSVWVRRVATLALESVRVETWAHHWFNIFLHDGKPEIRWGAGQLFWACVDGRFRTWAWPLVSQAGIADRIRGEAILLLNAAAQSSEKKDRALRETFLWHKVADLRAVCHPWHPEAAWEDLSSR